MATWQEARRAKENRQQRQRRHFTRAMLSHLRCTDCGEKLPLVVVALGWNTHATCGPDARWEMRR